MAKVNGSFKKQIKQLNKISKRFTKSVKEVDRSIIKMHRVFDDMQSSLAKAEAMQAKLVFQHQDKKVNRVSKTEVAKKAA